MNELISEQKEKEIINQVLQFLDSDEPINDISEFLEDEIRNINKNHRDIGLKDINGKNIYADSSIVEFELNINKEEVKIIGYFSYIKEELRYEFYQHFKQREKFIKTYLSPIDSRLTGEFKIIDTIRENKLGLIK